MAVIGTFFDMAILAYRVDHERVVLVHVYYPGHEFIVYQVLNAYGLRWTSFVTARYLGAIARFCLPVFFLSVFPDSQRGGTPLNFAPGVCWLHAGCVCPSCEPGRKKQGRHDGERYARGVECEEAAEACLHSESASVCDE